LTLVAAWIRSTSVGDELLVASDSRVRGGIKIDHAPKIFRLERNDAVIAYCGPTLVAYPILLQIKSGLDGYDETRNRVIDIVDLKAHVEKIIERLRYPIEDLPSQDGSNKQFKFMLAGYSWKTNRFRVWIFRYDVSTGAFNAFSMMNKHRVQFMSDCDENEKTAGIYLQNFFRKISPKDRILAWEPLKVLIQMIHDNKVEDIGGPPQLVKVYRHANTLPINILWAEAYFKNYLKRNYFYITHLGRPLLGYERSRYLTLDTTTFELIEPWKIQYQLERYKDEEEEGVKSHLKQKVLIVISNIYRKKSLQEKLRDVRDYQQILEIIQNEGFMPCS